MGVTTRKKIIPITIGATTAPSAIPNLNHNLFNGVNIFEFINPKTKKIAEIIADQTLIGSSCTIKGQILIIKKTTKKTKPKLLLELIFIFGGNMCF